MISSLLIMTISPVVAQLRCGSFNIYLDEFTGPPGVTIIQETPPTISSSSLPIGQMKFFVKINATTFRSPVICDRIISV